VGAIVFSNINLRSSYNHIKMAPEKEFKIAFRTHSGYYKFLIIPFVLTNALVTFQSLMNEVFREYLRKFILVFFYDILVNSQTLNDHYNTHKLFLNY